MKLIQYFIICVMLVVSLKSNANAYNSNQNDSVYTVVDKLPKLKGAKGSLSTYVIRSVKYPTEARLRAIEGDVIVNFIVTAKGQVTDVNIQEGAHPILADAVRKYVENSGPWKPGKVKKVPVNTQMSIPVQFRLNESDRQLADQLKTFNMVEERPLFVIDDLVIEDFAVIEDYNVESVRVIKGQKAIDLYGERAKNGVVVIKSKRGTPPIY